MKIAWEIPSNKIGGRIDVVEPKPMISLLGYDLHVMSNPCLI